jgi:nicotinamide mononucleotide transporter
MLQEIHLLGQSTSVLELIAMLFGIAGVWLTTRQSIWCFPVGIVNVALYAWLFISPDVKLYADAMLQCIYIILLFYGWVKWAEKSKDEKYKRSRRIGSRDFTKATLTVIASTIVLGLFLSRYTDASLPWIDSALSCSSLAAQWMIAKRYIENWIVWIMVDIIYLPMYYQKHLPLTVILYFIFLVMAFKGYAEWKKNTVKHGR